MCWSPPSFRFRSSGAEPGNVHSNKLLDEADVAIQGTHFENCGSGGGVQFLF